MTARRELEIKLALPPTSVERLKKILIIQALKEPAKRATEVSVYFDTDKHKFRKSGLMLRMRRIGTRYVQTISAIGHVGVADQRQYCDRPPPEPFDANMGTSAEFLAVDC